MKKETRKERNKKKKLKEKTGEGLAEKRRRANDGAEGGSQGGKIEEPTLAVQQSSDEEKAASETVSVRGSSAGAEELSVKESDEKTGGGEKAPERYPSTACYVDFENLFFTMRSNNKVPSVTRLVRTLNRMSREIAGEGFYKTAVYANWDHIVPQSRHAQNDWNLVGWRTVSVPTREDYWTGNPIKNLVDFVMSLDILEDAFTGDTDIFFIVSGDSDFVEVVERLKRKRRKVIVVSLKPNLSFRLREAADEFYVLTFDELEGSEPPPHDSYRTGKAIPRQENGRSAGRATDDEFQILCRCIDRAEKDQGFRPVQWKVVRDEYFLREVHTSPEEADRFVSQLADSGFVVLKKQTVKGKGIFTMISLPDRR